MGAWRDTVAMSTAAQPKQPLAVLGAGRLGLCWALCAEAAGYPVVAVDIFPSYVDAINSKRLVSHEPQVTEMLARATKLRATSSVREAALSAQTLFVFVQTPSSGGDRHYDHSHLSDVLCQLNALRVRDKHIVICCTVMPGYCATIAPELLRDCEGVRVSYSPAFIAQGEIVAGLLAPDLVLVGSPTDESAAELRSIHESLLSSSEAQQAQARRHGSVELAAQNQPSLRVMSPASAEIAKLSLNCFITLKIAFANFVADVADATDGANNSATAANAAALTAASAVSSAGRVDKHVILEALGCDSRVGPKCLLPGYGFGGPCFPRDNRALAQHARTLGVDVSVPEATDAANGAHARAQAQLVCAGLAAAEAAATNAQSSGHGALHANGSNHGLLANGTHAGPAKSTVVLFHDVTYKPRCPVPIVQESQKLQVARLVRLAGWPVVIVDRPAVLDAVRRDYGTLFQYRDQAAAGAANGVSQGPGKRGAAEAAEVDGESFLGMDEPKRMRIAGDVSARGAQVMEGSTTAQSAADGEQPRSAEDEERRLAELAAEKRGEGRRTLPTTFTS